MDAMQRIKDLGLMLMLAVALTIGLAHAQAGAAPADDPSGSANSAACAVDAVESDGDLSGEWLDPLRRGPDGGAAKNY